MNQVDAAGVTHLSLPRRVASTPLQLSAVSTRLTSVGNVSLTNTQLPRALHDGPSCAVGTLAEYAAWFGDECRSILSVDVKSKTAVSKVDSDTMQALHMADRAIRHTKELLHLGTANHAVDVWRTDAANVHARRQRLLTPGGMAVQAVIDSGDGNCGEQTRVTKAMLLTERTTRPVLHVKAVGVDHNFVLLGDPRELSEREVVVADSWVTFPTAHLLSEGRFKMEKIVDQSPPQAGTAPLDAPAHVVTMMDSGESRAEAKLHINNVWNRGGSMFEDHVSVLALNNAYREEGGRSVRFDRFPRPWIESRISSLSEFLMWSEGGVGEDES